MDYRIVDTIQNEELKDFVKDFITNNSTEDKVNEANQIADIMMMLLVREGKIQPGVYQSFIDIALAASLLHNIYYDRNDITTLLKLRKEVYSLEISNDITSLIEGTIQMCEQQDGKYTVIPQLVPREMTLEKLFSEAIWLNKHFTLKDTIGDK